MNIPNTFYPMITQRLKKINRVYGEREGNSTVKPIQMEEGNLDMENIHHAKSSLCIKFLLHNTIILANIISPTKEAMTALHDFRATNGFSIKTGNMQFHMQTDSAFQYAAYFPGFNASTQTNTSVAYCKSKEERDRFLNAFIIALQEYRAYDFGQEKIGDVEQKIVNTYTPIIFNSSDMVEWYSNV